jgi:hypothetical protein
MKHGDVFEKLDPPPGGLAKLRAKLEEGRRGSWSRWIGVGSLALGLAALVLVFTRPGRERASFTWGHTGASEVGLGLTRVQAEVLTVADESQETVAIERVRSGDPRVVIYRVGSVE